MGALWPSMARSDYSQWPNPASHRERLVQSRQWVREKRDLHGGGGPPGNRMEGSMSSFEGSRPQASDYPAPATKTTSKGRPWTIASFVCGVVAIIFFPIILGPA